MKLQTKVIKTWRPVAKPRPKVSSYSMLAAKPPVPPPVSPKPGSKVYLYVYDNDTGNPVSVPQYYPNPHFTSQGSVESNVAYPYAKEKAEKDFVGTPQPAKRSGRQRVRDQAQKAEKGYKVLAEVTPALRSSSRGGKMFVKQRNRMERFTKESPDHIPTEEEEKRKLDSLRSTLGETDTWATPWNMATKSPTAVKYITAKRLVGPMNRSSRGRDPLGFMPKPPAFWRAKVEQNFPTNGPTPAKSFQWRSPGYVMPTENGGSISHRPGSAPPVESPTFYEQDYQGNRPGNIYEENDGYHSEYDMPSRPASVALPCARIYFNAKEYSGAPHRRQGLRKGIQVYTPVPNIQHDFNARAKGWHRNY